MSTDHKNKDHADFQSQYHQSSNFGSMEDSNDMKAKGDGKVKLSNNDHLSETDKKKIADAMDKMQRKSENTDEREASREEG